MDQEEITVVLNIYKRAQHLDEQFESIMNQTIKPHKIIIWNNGCSDDFTKYKNNSDVLFFDSNHNFGVWSRFFISFIANTKYVCIFDDDTIPGSKWFENCINTLSIIGNGILGTCGMIFKPGDDYDHIRRVGWVDPNENITEVDAICHSWFFPRKMFDAYINDLPNTEQFKTFGEDMHLSHTYQKFKNIKTYVPPHPKNKPELWGSDFNKGWAYGTEKCAISVSMPFKNFTIPFRRLINLNYKTASNQNLFIKDYNKSLEFFINKIKLLEPFTLIRLSDKEFSVLNNISADKQIDGWTFKQNSILIDHLKNVLKLNNSNVYFGIQHKCNNDIYFNYYVKNIVDNSNLTFSTIFNNANYIKFINFLNEANFNVILIANKKPLYDKIGNIGILDYLNIDSNLTENWDNKYNFYINKTKELCKKYTNKIFFLSGGPIAKILIYHMYLENPNNIYLDVGSSIDYYVKNMFTRDFHKLDSASNNHVCSF